MGEDPAETKYCPICDTESTVKKTVPWQDDVCTTCANPIPENTN